MTSLNMRHKYTIMVALLPALTSCHPPSAHVSPPPAQIKDYLPAKVSFLRELSAQAPGPDRARVTDPNGHATRQAKEASFHWTLKAIDKRWLPPDPNVLRERLVMIQDALGPNDVTYSQWQAQHHIVQVAQMRTIVLIRVRPLPPDPTCKLTKEARVALARDVVTHLIRAEIDFVLNEPTGRKRTKKAIMADVVTASFERADIRVCQDGVHAPCAPPQVLEAGRLFHVWWWRCIDWWTDGSEVGLYFLKTEFGPWVPSYTSGLDATWFEGSPYKNKSGRSGNGLPPRR
jgi:hypothetical protein